MVESFILKIASTVLGQGLAVSTLKSAIEVYSIFEAVDAINDCVCSQSTCDEFPNQAFNVVSEKMTEKIVEKILEAESDTISLERRKSGLYVASRICRPVLVPEQSLMRDSRWSAVKTWQTGRWLS